MRSFEKGIACAFLLMLALCQRTPITHREQLHLVPEGELLTLADTQYTQFLSKATVVSNTPQADEVTAVGKNIANAVQQYFSEHNLSSRLKNYNWQFHLVQDTTANAWCMPGGKVAVYTGILPYTQNDTGLAVVLGHEISHAVAQHGDERLSQQLLIQLGGSSLGLALAQQPALAQNLFLAAYGLGSQVGVLLPYSRKQESEADHLGLIFMAMAGYDPHAAIPFWERLMQANKNAPPVFLSDHPSDSQRIKKIQELMPEAMKYYHPKG